MSERANERTSHDENERRKRWNAKPAGVTYKLITYFRFEHVLSVYFAMMYKDVDKTIQFCFAH